MQPLKCNGKKYLMTWKLLQVKLLHTNQIQNNIYRTFQPHHSDAAIFVPEKILTLRMFIIQTC